jgi:hypothetical protein
MIRSREKSVIAGRAPRGEPTRSPARRPAPCAASAVGSGSTCGRGRRSRTPIPSPHQPWSVEVAWATSRLDEGTQETPGLQLGQRRPR